jgi:GT2 family glycosyltransferase
VNRLSIIIPVYNDRENLDKCLRALAQSSFTDFQLIVVDDGSRDGSDQVAEGRCDRLVRLQSNRGQAVARNLGVSHAEADLLFFLDADVMVQPHTLAQILQAFEDDPGISALFCSYQADTPPQNFVSQFKNLQHHFTHKNGRREAATFCGGFGAIRRKVFEDIGGFCKDMRYMEDVQLGYRLHRAGHRILLCPAIQLTHNKRYSLISLARSDVFQRAVPWTRLMLEHREFNNDLNTSSNNIASVVVVFLMLLAVFVHPPGLTGWLALESVLAGILVLLNLRFLGFVLRARGFLFALRAVPMLWLQYAYSGFGLGLGILAHLRGKAAGKT